MGHLIIFFWWLLGGLWFINWPQDQSKASISYPTIVGYEIQAFVPTLGITHLLVIFKNVQNLVCPTLFIDGSSLPVS